ncbi:hypothetical protein D9599_05775 [Roseomonas sp. KE2513]|nr:hypothetical protein [Roseomonas sp. KE2513]
MLEATHPAPRVIATLCDAGGPLYVYRGARVASNGKGNVFSFTLVGFPGGGLSGLSSIELIVRLVDGWCDTEWLPALYRTPGQGAPAE